MSKFKIMLSGIVTYWIAMLVDVQNVYASNGNLVNGVNKLMNDAESAMVKLSVSVAVIALMYFGIKIKTSDEHEAPKYKKQAKDLFIWLAIIVCAGSIIIGFIGYFGVTL